MKLYTNENNPSALKVLISASFAGKDVSLELVNVEDKRFQTPKRLPVLQLDSGLQLFSANSGARYLLPPADSSKEVQIDEWLEFEASQLSSTILNGFSASGKIDSNSRAVLVKLLTLLDSELAEKQYLVGDAISVADICVWSSLFPIISEPQQVKELFSEKNNLIKWFDNLKNQPQFSDAVSKICPKPGIWSLQNLANAIWAPSPATGDSSGQKLLLNQENSVDSNGSPVREESVTEAELTAASEAWQQGGAKRSQKPQVTPVLPVKGERNVLITSALPYVNNVPHLGNIIGCVLSADVFARFCRLRNCNTLYICGTDEYGTATETKAIEEGLTPQQICDKYFKIHEEIYRWFNIGFDHFGRTTTREQTVICQEMFLDLHKAGLMTTQSMEQLLCEKCDRFLADRFVEGTCPKCKYEDARGDQCDGCGNLINATELINARCKVCSSAPVIRHSDQFFLELPKVEPQLREWLDRVTDDWSHNAKVITRSWLKDGLKSRCITRDLKWGIPVPLPQYSSKVFYVWFDAPIGYMSMTSCYTDQWRQWWQPDGQSEVKLYQFMAKDNVPFHSVMFPSSLIGAAKGYTLVSHLMATEYLNYEDGKFSKSRGVGVFGTDARDTGISSDVWRFYLLYVRPESQDSSFSWLDLATKNNSELLNNLGNFINRALVFAEKSFNGRVPPVSLTAADVTLLALVNRELAGYVASVEKARLRDGIRHILSVSRHGNQYMQSQQPWVLLKGSDADRTRAGTVIAVCCNICCLLAALLHPYLPDTAATLRAQLNASAADCLAIPDQFAPLLPEGHQLGKPAPLFTKLDLDHIETLKKKYAGNQKSRTPEAEAKKGSVAELTEAVAKQAEVVRKMKSGGSAKAEWQPHVATLLELKKQLVAAEANEAKPAAEGKKTESVAELTEAVAKQAEVVRKMKTGGAAKAEWQPHVATLLELKKQLVAAEANEAKPAAEGKKTESVAELTEAVAKQAEVVRKIKSGGAAKAEWQPHVATLLELKKQLAAAEASQPKVEAAKPEAAKPEATKPEPVKLVENQGTVSKPAGNQEPVSKPAGSGEKIAELEAQVAKQADLVRDLKSGGASKTDVAAQVAKLLELKGQLAATNGVDSAATGGGKKKKGKK